MKVLLVNTLYHPDELGGAERVVRRLAQVFPEFGARPSIACLAPNGEPTTDEVDGVEVHRVPLRNVYDFLPPERRPAILKPLWHAIDSANVVMARAFGRVVDMVRPDIVHTHNVTGFSPLVWRAAARRDVPVVHTIHDHYLLCARSTMFLHGANCTSRHMECAVFSAARLRHASAVQAVVGVSEYVLNRHLSFGAFRKTRISRVIRNPIPRGSGSRGTQREGDGPMRFGYLGRLDPAKGVDVLLAAIRSLPLSGWTLDIAGSGPPEYAGALRELGSRPNIRFLGHRPVEEFLDSIDVLVVPSRSNEAFSLVVGEAFAAGVPVVASRVGGIPEIVEDGATGLLVPPGSAAELAEALRRFVAQPALAEAMRPACVSAAASFDPNVIARQYVELYAMVTAARTRPDALSRGPSTP